VAVRARRGRRRRGIICLRNGERRERGGGRREGDTHRGRSERPWSAGHLKSSPASVRADGGIPG
jgi:hypothetical protein